MEELIIDFIKTYSLPLAGIALAGVVLLCILKYGNVFSKLEENVRHWIYLAIAVGFSLIAAAIYLLATKQFAAEYYFALAGAIFTLDQAIYATIKATPLGDLLSKAFDAMFSKIKKPTAEQITETPEADKTHTETAEKGATTPESNDSDQVNE